MDHVAVIVFRVINMRPTDSTHVDGLQYHVRLATAQNIDVSCVRIC